MGVYVKNWTTASYRLHRGCWHATCLATHETMQCNIPCNDRTLRKKSCKNRCGEQNAVLLSTTISSNFPFRCAVFVAKCKLLGNFSCNLCYIETVSCLSHHSLSLHFFSFWPQTLLSWNYSMITYIDILLLIWWHCEAELWGQSDTEPSVSTNTGPKELKSQLTCEMLTSLYSLYATCALERLTVTWIKGEKLISFYPKQC